MQVVLGIAEDAAGKDEINAMLREAWRHFMGLRMFQPLRRGFALDLEKQADLAVVDRVWICPMTRRALATASRWPGASSGKPNTQSGAVRCAVEASMILG